MREPRNVTEKWFDSNKDWWIKWIKQNIHSDKKIEKELWRIVRYARDSAYGKGRNTGIEYAIRKYGLKKEN